MRSSIESDVDSLALDLFKRRKSLKRYYKLFSVAIGLISIVLFSNFYIGFNKYSELGFLSKMDIFFIIYPVISILIIFDSRNKISNILKLNADSITRLKDI